MEKFITSDIESDERLWEFWAEFNCLRVSIPTPIFSMMEQFAKENFDPIFDAPQTLFPDDTIETFYRTIRVIENKLHKLAEDVLNPIVVK